MEKVSVVLDTNTFLHYVSLDQIDWRELFPNQNVTLLICPPVIRELNRHKDGPRTPKLRDRAAAALRKIGAWADSPLPAVLQEGVIVEFSVHDSGIDFAAHNLVRDISDDHLIAALIEMQARASSAAVLLLTTDIGLKLKAKAHGFAVASLPDSALLPDEDLPSEKKIKELEAQVRVLENTRPKLRLLFPDGTDRLKLQFEQEGELTESDIASRMADLRNRFPQMTEPDEAGSGSSDTAPTTLIQLLGAASKFGQINPDRIREYNGALKTFFTEYEKYLDELREFYAWASRTAAINFKLVNDGSCPAEDVDIFMHFPDGFELLRERDFEKKPEAPKAPRKPRSMFEETTQAMRVSALNLPNNYLYAQSLADIRMPAGRSNVSGPRIRRTNSYEVNVNVEKAKHGIEETLDTMYLTFDSLETRRGFAIDYKIHATNLPTPAKGTLHVIV